jgi:hypothetical protein
MIDKQTLIRRIEICKPCPHATLDFICNKCGCIIKLKAMLIGSTCPIDKW